MSAARPWYREPLLHFVIAGVLLAGARSALRPREAPPPIVLTDALDAALASEHRAARGAPASDAELEGARLRWIHEEALYREALALGLDEGDAIVRRRLIQKMTFVLEASLDLAPPTDDAAAAYLEAHASELALPERRTLEHRFFGDFGTTPLATAALARDTLIGGGEVTGDPFLAASGFEGISESELSRIVSPSAATAVFALDEGTWSEPISVGRGALLIRVRAITPARPPTLASVRSRIDAALLDAARTQELERAIDGVVDRYEVVRE